MQAPAEPENQPETLGDLPEWDLSDLYAGPDAPELKRDLESADTDARAFQARYQNTLADLDGAAILIQVRLSPRNSKLSGIGPFALRQPGSRQQDIFLKSF